MAKTKRAFARDYRVLAGNMELSKLCPQEISKKITPWPDIFHFVVFFFKQLLKLRWGCLTDYFESLWG